VRKVMKQTEKQIQTTVCPPHTIKLFIGCACSVICHCTGVSCQPVTLTRSNTTAWSLVCDTEYVLLAGHYGTSVGWMSCSVCTRHSFIDS
jgi:hypothetical protein